MTKSFREQLEEERAAEEAATVTDQNTQREAIKKLQEEKRAACETAAKLMDGPLREAAAVYSRGAVTLEVRCIEQHSTGSGHSVQTGHQLIVTRTAARPPKTNVTFDYDRKTVHFDGQAAQGMNSVIITTPDEAQQLVRAVLQEVGLKKAPVTGR